MRRSYLLGFSSLLILLVVVTAIYAGIIDLDPNRPGLKIIPPGPLASVPVGEVSGSLNLRYSGPRGFLKHSLELWLEGDQKLRSSGGYKVSGTGLQLSASFKLKHVIEQVDLGAVHAEEDLEEREPLEPRPSQRTAFVSGYRFIRKVQNATHDSFLWDTDPDDHELPPYHIVHCARQHVSLASSQKDPMEIFREQPVVWGCFFNHEKDQEWMDIFSKAKWSDEDFEHAASKSDRAVLVRMWLNVDRKEAPNET